MNPEGEYADGVDVSLIRWSLSLFTPAERLDILAEFADFVVQARQRNGLQPIPGDSPNAGSVRSASSQLVESQPFSTAPTVNTFDVDIVHSRDPENLDPYLAALQELDARYRHRPEFRPDESHLAATGHQLLLTRFGPLDVLGAIGGGWTYADLLPRSQLMEVAPGLAVRVLDLETIIQIKEEVGGEKDLATLPVLRRTLAEIRRRQASGE